MLYHVHASDGRRLGPQSLESIRASVAAGEIDPNGALAWTEGMANWIPLKQALGLEAPAMPTESASAVQELIPVKNGRALAAYYCAIFGIIPCFTPILGPIALIFGILGLKAIKRQPSLPGKFHAWLGVILGGIETFFLLLWLVFFVIGMGTALARGHH